METDRKIAECRQTVQKWLSNNSYSSLAEQTGIPRQDVSKWFAGKARPSIKSIVAMAKVLGVHPIELGAMLMIKWIERQLHLNEP